MTCMLSPESLQSTPEDPIANHCADCGASFRVGGFINGRHLCDPCWKNNYDPNAEPDGGGKAAQPVRTHCALCKRTPVHAPGDNVCLDCTSFMGGDKHAPTRPKLKAPVIVEHPKTWPSHDAGPNWED